MQTSRGPTGNDGRVEPSGIPMGCVGNVCHNPWPMRITRDWLQDHGTVVESAGLAALSRHRSTLLPNR